MFISVVVGILLVPAAASALDLDLEESLRQLHEQHRQAENSDLAIAKDGMTLDQAIESVRRRGDVDRILSAETRRDGDREMHYIRYLTRDGKVKTAKIRGRSLR
jgi:tagatose-1,6-bisphosphate aldolase